MANFGLRLRTSKFRHVYGAQTRREHSFENVRITRNTHDSNFCAVNPKFLAVVLESSGGGSFAVLDVNRPGRVDINCPKVCGHAGAIMDVKWNPFNDHVIASASDDSTVKLWTIPETGLNGSLTEWSADLHGHSRKVAYLEWHPTAENVLLSVGFDKQLMVWNVEQAEPITSLAPHPDTIFSVSWARDGSLVASTCKDKNLRVLDPRTSTVAMEMPGHQSPKASKCVFVDDHFVFTTGFSRISDRQYSLWDVRKSGRPVVANDLDCSSGTILPYFDPDTKMVYMAGKGDGMIRFVEIQSNPTDVFFLNYYQSPLPQRGLGMMPKRGVDTSKNEITRFYKLHASKNLVEPIPMIAPRKAEGYQADIYPPTCSNLASLTADEWRSGVNRGPILLNMEDGSIIDRPRTTMSAAVQSPIGSLSKAPEITTYKTVTKTSSPPLNHAPQSFTDLPTALRTSPDGLQSSLATTDSTVHINGKDKPTTEVPSSIKNIRRLSMNFENQESQHSPSPPSISSAQSLSSLRSSQSPSPSSPSPVHPARTVSYTVLNGVRNEPVAHHSEQSTSGLTVNQSNSEGGAFSPLSDHVSAVKLVLSPPLSPTVTTTPSNAIHVRKVWTPPVSPVTVAPNQWAASPTSDSELKKAYFRQLDEIKSLQEQLSVKDRRIHELEAELSQIRAEGAVPSVGESNC